MVLHGLYEKRKNQMFGHTFYKHSVDLYFLWDPNYKISRLLLRKCSKKESSNFFI